MVIGRSWKRGFPSAPGNKLPEKVGNYFNDALQVVTHRSGGNAGVRSSSSRGLA